MDRPFRDTNPSSDFRPKKGRDEACKGSTLVNLIVDHRKVFS